MKSIIFWSIGLVSLPLIISFIFKKLEKRSAIKKKNRENRSRKATK